MIAKGRSFGAVCFQCRLRLLRQLTPRYISSDTNNHVVDKDAPKNGVNNDAIEDSKNESTDNDLLFRRVSSAQRLDTNSEGSVPPDDATKNAAHETPDRDLSFRSVSSARFWDMGNEDSSHRAGAINDAADDTANDLFSFRRPFFPDIATGGETLVPAKDAVYDAIKDATKDAAGDRTETAHKAAHKFRRVRSADRLIRPPRLRRNPLQRMSGRRILTESSEELSVPMLGKASHAIVMRDGGIKEKKKIPPKDPEVEPEHFQVEAAAIEAQVAKQRGPLSLEMLRSGIEELRPEIDKVLLEKDFRKLQNFLTTGFLSAQLQAYIQWRQSELESESQQSIDSLPRPEYPWILETTPWVPLPTQSSAGSRTTSLMRGYITEKMAPKDRLAVFLMRECWGLSIVEVQALLGETYVTLQNRDFALLMRGTRRFINNLGKFWLEPGETIEMVEDQKMLRLVTPKQKSESILKDLDGTLRSITTKTFPIHLVASSVPSDDVLEELGRITNSHVRESDSQARLHVSWIEVQSRVSQGFGSLEDVAHIVFRLLLLASKSQEIPSTLLVSELLEESSGRLIEDAISKNKLMWKDRLAKWGRYVLPLGSEESTADPEESTADPEEITADPEMPIKQFELPFEPLKEIETEKLGENLATVEIFHDTTFPNSPVKWSDTSRTSTIAHFGQVLHSYSPEDANQEISDLISNNDRRVFSPMTPHPLQLSKYEAIDSDNSPLATAKSTVVLYFWPSPSSNPAKKGDSQKVSKRKPSRANDTPPAPPLELRLTVIDDEIQGIESLRAIKQMHNTDVMMPSSFVDVRFTQTQYETLMAPDHETLASWQPLADFLGRARLDLAKGKLEMPPRQRFPIPRRIFLKDLSAPPKKTSKKRAPDPEELVSVSYEFVGLELHRSISQSYDDHRLTYTSIEGGQGGGRRAEVTLEPLERSAFATTPASGGDSLQDFLACCSRFVADSSMWSGLDNKKQS